MAPPPSEIIPVTVADAQREMRFAYYGGAPGMLVSAAVWTVAGCVALARPPDRAIGTLFVGGMLIHPVSLGFLKLLGRPAKHRAENPFGSLALATTLGMILALPLAYGVSRVRIEWFFPAMLCIIGGRYLSFATMFGDRTYWFCGTALAVAGLGLATVYASPVAGAFTGAAIEAGFAVLIARGARVETD